MEPNSFKGTKPQINLSDLQTIEQEHGFVLPDDYKTHLLQFNGGWPTRRAFLQPAQEAAAQPVERKISDFYAVRYGEDTLEESIDSLRGNLHPDLVPFGSEAGGDQFVLSVGAQDYGHVYYVAHEAYSPPEYAYDEDTDISTPPAPLAYGAGVHFLAPSFSAFLAGLVAGTPA